MIGVLAHSREREIAREFFELFKTPWEFARSGQRYDVLLCTLDECEPAGSRLVLRYRGARTSYDKEDRLLTRSDSEGATFSYNGRRFPIYGRVATVPANPLSLLDDDRGQQSLVGLSDSGHASVVRIGYDLFEEVRHLLTAGQPPANAGTPTLELHIALLRELITRSGMPLVEVPPVPDGYSFITCLTHDLDHPVLRNHWMDHTMLGFLYRATVGSLIEVCRGRKGLGDACKNWARPTELPFVHLGIAEDPWREFDRYLEMEAGLGVDLLCHAAAGLCLAGAPMGRRQRNAPHVMPSAISR